jgi:hypothetical protein
MSALLRYRPPLCNRSKCRDRRSDQIGDRRLDTNLRHRTIDVGIEAKPGDRRFLQPEAPQGARIEPRRAAGTRDRGAKAESGPDKRAAAGNRPEACFEPGRGQARCDNARHVPDRLIGRHGAVGGDCRDAAPRRRPAPRSPASSMWIWQRRRPFPSSLMIEPMQVRSPPSQRWQPTKAAS